VWKKRLSTFLGGEVGSCVLVLVLVNQISNQFVGEGMAKAKQTTNNASQEHAMQKEIKSMDTKQITVI
jgi:hypothetical protein